MLNRLKSKFTLEHFGVKSIHNSSMIDVPGEICYSFDDLKTREAAKWDQFGTETNSFH